jgi:hypothetical protein
MTPLSVVLDVKIKMISIILDEVLTLPWLLQVCGNSMSFTVHLSAEGHLDMVFFIGDKQG